MLKILDAPYPDAGFLGSYEWLDLTSPENWDRALRGLADNLAPSSRAESASSEATIPGPESPSFRNRDDELERVLRGLTNAAGPHFWLVIAPPQLGKTWFMDHLAAKMLEEPNGWAARRVDVREHPDEMRGDAALLLAHLFGLSRPSTSGGIAQGILKGKKPYLCLLDSAELLEEETASTLRSCLSEIYRLVQRAGNNDVRLAFIVASRRDDEWRGVTPNRLSALPLTEFKIDVVQDALQDLARQMGRTFAASELQENAKLVHRLSEGLPALLVLCLRWIQTEEWLGMERLKSQRLFEKLAQPYIQQGLLSQDSLFPWSREHDGEQQQLALEQAFRVLAPYRLFTQSHLRHHFQSDPVFKRVVEDVEWSMEDLWNAISNTALLSRPLDEPWQEDPTGDPPAPLSSLLRV